MFKLDTLRIYNRDFTLTLITFLSEMFLHITNTLTEMFDVT